MTEEELRTRYLELEEKRFAHQQRMDENLLEQESERLALAWQQLSLEEERFRHFKNGD